MQQFGPRQPQLVFIHIPKTGGITFRRMLKARVAVWPPNRLWNHERTLGFYKIGNFKDRLQWITTLSEKEKQRIKYFEGHYGFGIHEYLPGPVRYLTILQDPIERTISTYYHLNKPEVRKRHGVPEVDFEQLLTMGRSWGGTHGHCFDNCQVRFLAGERGIPIDVEFGQCDENMLALAKKRLAEDFFFFGLLENFDQSVVLCKRQLGWRFIAYITANVTKNRLSVESVDKRVLRLIELHNALDIELYNFGSKLFHERVRELGEPFLLDLAKFRRFNGIVNKIFRFHRWRHLTASDKASAQVIKRTFRGTYDLGQTYTGKRRIHA